MVRARLAPRRTALQTDRKSTRLNSSHMSISYAVFCLKKKNSHDAAAANVSPEDPAKVLHGRQAPLVPLHLPHDPRTSVSQRTNRPVAAANTCPSRSLF